MNFPPVHGCYCCCSNDDCCCCSSSGSSSATMNASHSTNLAIFCPNNANNTITLKEDKNVASHHSSSSSSSSKRKGQNLSLLSSSCRYVTQRQCINLACMFSLTLLSFVSVGICSEIPINSSNFLNGESPSPESLPPFGNTADAPSIPTASSSSSSNVVVPGPPPPSSSSSSPTVQQAAGASQVPSVTTQSYFINGYANQIQNTSVTDLRALAKNKPIQLQFRTVCPFGNLINDDKFALRFNSAGFLTYLNLPQEAQLHLSRSVVADGKWHSVTFSGNHVFLDDPDSEDRYGTSIIWDSGTDNETDHHHKLFFFDGFVGCIRLGVQANISLHSDVIDPIQGSHSPAEQDPLVLFKGLQKYQPCNDNQFDLRSSAQCFQPDSFVLCSKCENNATCVFTDGKNECECPQTDDVRYISPFCNKEELANTSFSELAPESRDLHPAFGFGDQEDPFVSSTTGSSRSSFSAQSSPLMSSTTEHMTASSSVEQSRMAPESENCSCIHGKCVYEGRNWSCDCTGTGFRGRRCNNDVCDEQPDICGPYGKCFDSPEKESGYQCFCLPGYAGELCDFNFNECLSSPCVNNGTCEDGVNTYSCVCVAGYTGKNCQNEINECEPSPCENGSCIDLIADYRCVCLGGYTGKNCDIDIDECESNPCQNSGVCEDLIDDYRCQCNGTGFSGRNCENNIDDCESSPCKNGGNCTDEIKAYNCSCHFGYSGKDCGVDIPECDDEPCKNEGICYEKSHPQNYELTPALQHLEFEYSAAAGYVCQCREGYEGENCEIDIDECQRTESHGKSPCNGHGKCIDGVAEYRCECNKGFEGDFCETDINECEPNPCEQAKECKNLAGDYQCECNDGYGGKNCTVPLTGCITNICYNEGSCTPVYDEPTDSHSFQCACKSGFTGDTCNIKTTMAFNGSSLAEIVKNDDAFANNKYNLNFIFRTTLPDVVLAVGQGGTYFYLGLSGGKLNLQSSLINNLQGMSSGNNLHDGRWHKVVVSINSTHAILSADIEQVTLPIAEVEDIPQQPTGFNLTILGQLKSSLGFLNKHDLNPFVGCMQDVRINDDRILPEEADNVNLTNIVSQCIRKDQCNPNPCQNSGTCTDLWQKFTCNCPRPHLGGRCQYSYIAATFNHEDTPNSLATVDIPPGRFGGVFDISMFVRTREPRGTIFLLCDKERGLNGSYIEATITKSGNLVVQAKWTGTLDGGEEGGIKPEPYTVDGLLSDGKPHLISVQRDRSFVVIKVDDSEHFRKSHSNRVFNPTVMYIGGKPAQLTGQDTPTTVPIQEGHSGETSTSFPEGPIDNNTEGTAADIDANTDVLVPEPYRFKGTIQDVRINLSVPDSSPSLGHTFHSKAQSVYIVEFFNLTEIHQVKHPLGRVTIQNLREGTVSDDHCKSNPCHRGTCGVTWNDFKCDCFDEWDGKQCEVRLRCADVMCPERSACKNIGHTGFECVADASFDGKGHTTPHYVLRSSSLTDLTFNELSFRYRSKRAGNVIHISNGSNSLRVSLDTTPDESAVRFHLANDFVLSLINSTILDGEWHSVSIRFPSENPSDFSVALSFDKMEPKFETVEFHAHQYLRDLILTPNVDIVVGSSLSISSDIHSQYYRGCLRDVYIGSYRLPFISQSKLEEANPIIANRTYIETTAPTAFYINEVLHHSEQQLPRLSCILCYEKDCKNGGQCTDPTQSYDCSCASGFEGETCDRDINECIDNRCSYGSSCVDAVNNYTCTCAKGYEGWLCDMEIDECEGNGAEKCNNNGVCEDGIGEFKCDCFSEYTGIHCDKPKKSSCRDKPCENSATCKEVGMQSNGVSFECTCAQGWEGEFCSERIDFCKDARCENASDCENTLYGYKCNCKLGFAGIHCEVNVDECSSNPCKNGGSCMDGVNSFTCNCTDTGFTGLSCEEDVDECNEWPWSQICKEPLICENFVGSYQCSCPNKLMCGEHCDITNPCYEGQNVTCDNGGTCTATCDGLEKPEGACLCLPGFNGERCEQLQYTQPADESGVDILLIIIPVLAAILIAATVGIIILVRMARRKRATRGVYSPSQQEYCNPRVELDNVMKPPPEERLI